jgi:hypothetical protein
MEAWQVFFEEFQARGATADAQRFGRDDSLAEAAHDAYRATADRLTQEYGYHGDRALVLTRGFTAAVQRWLDDGSGDWEALRLELARRERELASGYGDRDFRGGIQR